MRLFHAGNEANDYTADEFVPVGVSPSSTFNQPGGYRSPSGKGGEYYYYLPSSWALMKDFTTGSIQIPGLPGALGINEAYFRFHFHSGQLSNGTGWPMWKIRDTNGTDILKLAQSDAGGGQFYLWGYRGDNSAFIQPTQYTFRNDVWNKVEMYVKLGLSGGIWTLWVNDILIWTVTGNISGASAQTYWTQLWHGCTSDSFSSGSRNWYAIDNTAVNIITDGTGSPFPGIAGVNQGRCGNGFCKRLKPTGNGSFSQLTNDYGTSTDNFQHVRELAGANPTGFVGTNTAGQKDTYLIQAPDPDFRGVNAAKLVAYAERNGPTISHMKMALKPAGGSEIDLPSGAGISIPSGGYGYISQIFETKSGGAILTPADLAAGAEAGMVFAT